MHDEVYSEDVTVLPKDTFAIVLFPDGECQLCMPKFKDKQPVPKPFLAGTMAGIKFMKDPEWVAALVEEFMDSRRHN